MTVETALYPPQLNTTLPTASDMVSEGDDHIRLTKTVIKTTFPNVAGAVSASHTEINYLAGVSSGIQSQINAKGAIAGQAWTGAHSFGGTLTVPTLAQGANTTGAANTAFVQAEWATRLPNYTGPINASTAELNRVAGVTSPIQTQINDVNAQWSIRFPNYTGPITASTTELNRLVGVTSSVQNQIDAKGAIAGQAWTGAQDFTSATITGPTLPTGTSNKALATTEFVTSTSFASALPAQSGNAGKYVKTDGNAAFWDWQYLTRVAVTGTTQAAATGNNYCLQNTAVTTVTLPAAPNDGDVVGIRCDNLRVDNVIARNGNLLLGLAEDMTVDNPYFPIVLQFRTTFGWRLVA